MSFILTGWEFIPGCDIISYASIEEALLKG